MATAAGEDTSNSGGGNEDESRPENDGTYECNICLDSAKDAVVSYCGHLFCWPCLHQWLETRPHRQVCPVCKAGISKDKVIPVYGRNATNKQDPRDKMPPRPAGQRPEPENTGGPFNYFGLGEGGFHMSFGIGAFPFGFFASSLNLGDRYFHANQQNLIQTADEQLLSRAFLFIAFIFILWLLVA